MILEKEIDAILGKNVRVSFFSPDYPSGGRCWDIVTPTMLFGYHDDKGYFLKFKDSETYISKETIRDIEVIGKNLIFLNLYTNHPNVKDLMNKVKEKEKV